MKEYQVYAVGNALVDMEFAVEDQYLESIQVEKGVMTLVDEARHDELYDALYASHGNKACGGSAANTLIAVSYFGGKSFYSCKIADDPSGHFFLEDLLAAGVDTNAKENMGKGTTGKCLVMITPDAERTMNTFLGISADISETEVQETAIASSEYLYMEGYLAGSPSALKAAIKAREVAEQNGVKIALTFSDPNMVNFCRSGLEAMLGDKKIDLLFCNEHEAMSWCNTDNIEASVEQLKQITKTFCVTLGANGCLVFDGEHLNQVPTNKVTAIDSNGAGDMFAGAFLHGITSGNSFTDAATFANAAAAELVKHYGPRLKPEGYKALLADAKLTG